MKRLPTWEETLARVAKVSKMGNKVVSITRARKQPTKAQKKKLLLAFFEGMERSIKEDQKP